MKVDVFEKKNSKIKEIEDDEDVLKRNGKVHKTYILI